MPTDKDKNRDKDKDKPIREEEPKKGKLEPVILDLCTRWAQKGPDHSINAVSFALANLKAQRVAIIRAGGQWDPFDLGDPSKPISIQPLLEARINAAPIGLSRSYEGRWIADCPGQCGGAECVDLDNLIFMCCSCWNAAYDHQWLKVTVPPTERRKQIERLLLKRPGKARNWLPHETLSDIVTENLARGVEV